MTSIDSFFRAALLATVFAGASGAAPAADTQAAWQGLMQNTAAASICGL